MIFSESFVILYGEEICKELKISLETFYDALSRVDQIIYLEEDVKDELLENRTYYELDLEKDEELLYQYYIVRHLTQGEIAKLLNVSQSTVSRNIQKLKKRLKDINNL